MTVCGEKGITRFYSPIWVAFSAATYSPALLEAAASHLFIFHILQNVLRLCTGLFPILRSDWTGRHGPRKRFRSGSECRFVKSQTPRSVFVVRCRAAGEHTQVKNRIRVCNETLITEVMIILKSAALFSFLFEWIIFTSCSAETHLPYWFPGFFSHSSVSFVCLFFVFLRHLMGSFLN